jgi:hypothetical protein
MGNSFSSSSSRPSSPAPVKYTYNTASARFTAKNDPKTMSTTKYGHVHVDVVSMTMYMMLVQPSMEMHWKMVSHAHAMLSKLLNPKFGQVLLALLHAVLAGGARVAASGVAAVRVRVPPRPAAQDVAVFAPLVHPGRRRRDDAARVAARVSSVVL